MDKHANLPIVTVVIPTYNRMPYIIEAIDSVIAQTYSNWELFVVDDGSTDGTIAAIKAMPDHRIHLIELPHQGRVALLRNKGAETGKGEWICFLDSDDTWMPCKLELQLKALHQSKGECCYGNFELMNNKGQIIPVKAGQFKPLSGNIIRQVLTTEASITVVSVMLSRRLFNETGGFSTDERLVYRDDYELVLRLAQHTEMIALNDVLLRVREHSGRRTNALAIAEAHVRSALPYEIFISNGAEKELEQIARKQQVRHMTRAAKINVRLGNYRLAYTQFKKAMKVMNGFKVANKHAFK